MDNPYSDSSEVAETTPETEAATFDVNAVQWMRSRRAMVRDSAQLADFQRELTELVTDLENRKGTTVAGAIGVTIIAIFVGLLITALGFGLMDVAGSWLGSMAEGS